jgi:hypothetical protein
MTHGAAIYAVQAAISYWQELLPYLDGWLTCIVVNLA